MSEAMILEVLKSYLNGSIEEGQKHKDMSGYVNAMKNVRDLINTLTGEK